MIIKIRKTIISWYILYSEAQNEKVPENSKSNITEEVDVEKEKIKSYRLQIAKKSRAIAGLERQLDEVPSRAELAQYQRRFLELYNQGNIYFFLFIGPTYEGCHCVDLFYKFPVIGIITIRLTIFRIIF